MVSPPGDWTTKNPLPWMAASSGPLVVWRVPWVKSRSVSVLPTPSPTWRDAVAWPMASSNRTVLPLKPWVFMFARLSPTMFSAVVLASNPESGAENDDMCFLLSKKNLISTRGAGAPRRIPGRDQFVRILFNSDQLLELAEGSQLAQEGGAVDRLGRVLILDLCDQQLQERVFVSERGRAGGGRGIAGRGGCCGVTD